MTILRAKTAFHVGPRRFVGAGDIVRSDDPIVAGREALFDVIEDVPPTVPAAPIAKARKSTKAPAARG